jgi:hypothetical protein
LNFRSEIVKLQTPSKKISNISSRYKKVEFLLDVSDKVDVKINASKTKYLTCILEVSGSNPTRNTDIDILLFSSVTRNECHDTALK